MLALIFLLGIFPMAYAGDAGLNTVDTDASLAFVLGAVGSYSTGSGETVDGKRSVVGRYKGSNRYNQILYSNPDILPLRPNTTYTVTFNYRILETPDKGFELLFFSDKGASLNDWVKSSIEFKGKKGDKGKKTLTASLKKYDDYRLLFNIIGQGAIAIDSVSLAMKGFAAPVAVADFEEHGVVSFGGIKYNFPNVRTDYVLNITDKGTAVSHRSSGTNVIVPFGEKMTFAGTLKYSKDTNHIIHHVRSHMENHGDWRDLTKMPVDWLRTDLNWQWNGKSALDCIDDRFNTPLHFPDSPEKVITGYVNFAEVVADPYDAAFNPAWDKNGDGAIDEGAFPDYLDPTTKNIAWNAYMAKYWTDSWLDQLKKKVDLVAAENFDGVFFDVLPAYITWMQVHPEMNETQLKQQCVDLLSKISAYAKERYGKAFLVTGNIDAGSLTYFKDLGKYLDGGYYQDILFHWHGTGEINDWVMNGEGNKRFDFLREQGLQPLEMENIGTGQHDQLHNFKNNDDKITKENFLTLFRFAIEVDSTPYLTTIFMFDNYNMFPRFSRILADAPPFTDTPYDDWVLGSKAADIFATGAGDDLAYGGPGNDKINGGRGNDEAYYTGKRADYDVVTDNGVTTVTARIGSEGSDTLIGFEGLIFSDDTEKIPAY